MRHSTEEQGDKELNLKDTYGSTDLNFLKEKLIITKHQINLAQLKKNVITSRSDMKIENLQNNIVLGLLKQVQNNYGGVSFDNALKAIEYLFTFLQGKEIHGIKTPSDKNKMGDFLIEQGVIVDPKGNFLEMTSSFDFDMNDRPIMKGLIYDGTDKNIKNKIYVADTKKFNGFNGAWTFVLGDDRYCVMNKQYYDILGQSPNSSGAAHETVHDLMDMSKFNTNKAMQICRSEKAKKTYNSLYYEEFCARAVTIQDIPDGDNEWNYELQYMTDSLIKNFSGTKPNNYLLEGSLMLQILYKETDNNIYKNEESIGNHLKTSGLNIQDEFVKILEDLKNIDHQKIKELFKEKFVAVKGCGVRFR